MDNRFITANEIAEILKCSAGTGYRIIRDLNAELREQKYMTLRGRVPRTYFEKRYNIPERV